ncbi:hypothetical protein F5Y18DRAFT_102649 [Xylariaceae sp. FL1019]|nr:hypothetical protein F5Y18DRAFT_102649 [Xylariaceae sp. FL1019]
MPQWPQHQEQYSSGDDELHESQSVGDDITGVSISDSGSSLGYDDQPELRKDKWQERLGPTLFPVMEMEYRDRKGIPKELEIKKEDWQKDLEMIEFGKAYHRRSHFSSAHLLTTPQIGPREVVDIDAFLIIIPQWWEQTMERTRRPVHLALSNANELDSPLVVDPSQPPAIKVHQSEEHLLEEASHMHHFPLDLGEVLSELKEKYSLKEVWSITQALHQSNREDQLEELLREFVGIVKRDRQEDTKWRYYFKDIGILVYYIAQDDEVKVFENSGFTQYRVEIRVETEESAFTTYEGHLMIYLSPGSKDHITKDEIIPELNYVHRIDFRHKCIEDKGIVTGTSHLNERFARSKWNRNWRFCLRDANREFLTEISLVGTGSSVEPLANEIGEEELCSTSESDV